MRKTLFLHIGHFKTGTTAIQEFLYLNPKLLRQHDLLYAKTKQEYSKHSDLAFSLYQAAGVKDLLHGYAKPETPQQVWAALFEELRASKRSRMIVSTEELMRLGCFPQAVADLKQIVETAPDIDIKVIAYLRAPESHLRSWYNQLVKMGCKTPSFNAAISQSIEPVHYDYALALRPWISLFGAQSIILRRYSKESRKDNALFRDFLSIFGIEMPDHGLTLLPGDPNPRIDDETLEVVRILQNSRASDWAINTTRDRFSSYFQEEQVEGFARSGDAFEQVRAQTLGGLDQLAQELPEFADTLEQFRGQLPVQDAGPASDGWLFAGLLLAEIDALRKTMNKQNVALVARLETLEARLSAKGSKPL
ncbi:hypothetical protein [Pseudophaeobacter arcticus]|uniref:hypothetical protein n=1 Tax=Pseudophaeobacter arcticus TaxID=385492 RepID=UPI003A96934B